MYIVEKVTKKQIRANIRHLQNTVQIKQLKSICSSYLEPNISQERTYLDHFFRGTVPLRQQF